jgi:hypothetical protein
VNFSILYHSGSCIGKLKYIEKTINSKSRIESFSFRWVHFGRVSGVFSEFCPIILQKWVLQFPMKREGLTENEQQIKKKETNFYPLVNNSKGA